ncbi:MAG: TIR domain-containing protein [Betaproteobacteria bacterium]|nr:TIR domain-containing protein [Betaproteobacteria bacterium]
MRIFISYSHKDSSYKDDLVEHLSPLVREGVVTTWHDREIQAGEGWQGKIDEELDRADIILLLISSSFIASNYCYEIEMQKAIAGHTTGQKLVIPIVIRPCDWSNAPFSNLQAVPTDARAISSWSNEDEAWIDVISKLRSTVQQFRLARPSLNEGELEGLRSLSGCLSEVMEALDEAHKYQGQITGIPTGIESLDYSTWGLKPGKLYVFASSLNLAKGHLVANIATHVGIHGGLPVFWYSPYVRATEFTQWAMSMETGISMQQFASGRLDVSDWDKLNATLGKLNDAPIYIDDSTQLDIEKIDESARLLAKECGGVGLIIVNNLQLVTFKQNSRNQQAYIAERLNLLAQELGAPVVVTLPLTSASADGTKVVNTPDDLGEWKRIEDQAHFVAVLHQFSPYSTRPYGGADIDLEIAHHFDGNTGYLPLIYFSHRAKFESAPLGTNETKKSAI